MASGGSPADLAGAVLLELIRLADAAGGALWLGRTGRAGLDRLAEAGASADVAPAAHLDTLDDARAWADATPGAAAVVLSETVPETRGRLVGSPRRGAR